MTDIVQQLRANGVVTIAQWDYLREAAAKEIERLRAVCKDKTILLKDAYAKLKQ